MIISIIITIITIRPLPLSSPSSPSSSSSSSSCHYRHHKHHHHHHHHKDTSIRVHNRVFSRVHNWVGFRVHNRGTFHYVIYGHQYDIWMHLNLICGKMKTLVISIIKIQMFTINNCEHGEVTMVIQLRRILAFWVVFSWIYDDWFVLVHNQME